MTRRYANTVQALPTRLSTSEPRGTLAVPSPDKDVRGSRSSVGSRGATVFYWFLKNVLIGPPFRLFFRPWVEGVENVPKDGPVILCPNHLSFIDSLLMPLMIQRPVVFLGKSDYFDKWYISWFYKAAGVIPVRREGGSAGEASLNAGVKALKDGYAIGIYPEGTRS